MQPTQNAPKQKKLNPHFPVTKIKKIIQENQQIGKLSNVVPPLIEQSLQFFLSDLIKKSEEVALEHGATKLNPAILKIALQNLQGYDFMKDVLDDVDDEIITVPLRKSTSKRRSKSESKIPQKQGEGQKQKRGRKKAKIEEVKEEKEGQEDNNQALQNQQ